MSDTHNSDFDAQLHAFVDGELDDTAAREVRVRLETDKEAAKLVQEYRAQREALHAQYNDVLDEPLTAEMRAALNRAPRQSRTGHGLRNLPVWQMAAAVALLFVGGAGGWWSHAFVTPERTASSTAMYVNRALGAHAVYTAEVRHPVEVGASEEQHLITWLSKRLGHDVHAPHLAEVGLELVGGRLLADGDRPAAQFMYENRHGQRVTLYVSLDTTNTETAFRVADNGGTSAIYWLEGGLGYALAGDLPREDMLKIARLVYDALSA